jgi:hypothetical protein
MTGSGVRQQALTGITWDSSQLDFELLKPNPNALAFFSTQLPKFIWDAAALEGNAFEPAEVELALTGEFIAGRSIFDERQVGALKIAHDVLFQLVADERFSLTKTVSDSLHKFVAVHEALEVGHFRGQGLATPGGGTVAVGAETFHASAPGKRGVVLVEEHRSLLEYLREVDDPRERAIAYFCAATRRQFYWDGNRRTSRLMMMGELLSNGFGAISISGERRAEYNAHLTALYLTGDATTLMAFVLDNRPS